MPSPIGHALGAIAAGWLVQPRPAAAPPRLGNAATLSFALLGMAPDLDLLIDAHRGPTHSIGATILVGLAAWALLRGRDGGLRLALAAAAAYGSHLVLDSLSPDQSPPLGFLAFWPFSSNYYQSPWPIFRGVSRRFNQPELFWLPNAYALLRELLILVPVVLLVGYVRRRPKAMAAVAGVIAILASGAGVIPGTGEAVEAASQRPTTETAAEGSPYRWAVMRYLSGEFDDAVTSVEAMTEREIATQLSHLGGDVRTITGATMLQTELALRPTRRVAGQVVAVHWQRARKLLRDRRRLEAPGEFERGWYLWVSAELQDARVLDEADRILTEARALFPRDPDVLLATGEAFEMRTFAGGLTSPPVPVAGRSVYLVDLDSEVKSALESAARYFQAALDVAPGENEARLRLGRVLYRLAQFDRAAEQLALVRRHPSDPTLSYLADLFAAAVECSRNEPARASRFYQEALRAIPAQSALIGLSSVYYDQGRGAEAARVLQSALQQASDHDPWLGYLNGDGWHKGFRRATLRALVTRK